MLVNMKSFLESCNLYTNHKGQGNSIIDNILQSNKFQKLPVDHIAVIEKYFFKMSLLDKFYENDKYKEMEVKQKFHKNYNHLKAKYIQEINRAELTKSEIIFRQEYRLSYTLKKGFSLNEEQKIKLLIYTLYSRNINIDDLALLIKNLKKTQKGIEIIMLILNSQNAEKLLLLKETIGNVKKLASLIDNNYSKQNNFISQIVATQLKKRLREKLINSLIIKLIHLKYVKGVDHKLF